MRLILLIVVVLYCNGLSDLAIVFAMIYAGIHDIVELRRNAK